MSGQGVLGCVGVGCEASRGVEVGCPIRGGEGGEERALTLHNALVHEHHERHLSDPHVRGGVALRQEVVPELRRLHGRHGGQARFPVGLHHVVRLAGGRGGVGWGGEGGGGAALSHWRPWVAMLNHVGLHATWVTDRGAPGGRAPPPLDERTTRGMQSYGKVK